MILKTLVALLLFGNYSYAGGLDLINQKHKANVQIIKQVSRKIGAVSVEQLKIKLKDAIIEIESRSPKSNVDTNQQLNYFSQVKRNYDTKKTPYPGELSSLVVCEEKYLPKEIKVKNKNVLTAFLSSSGAFGACVKNDVANLSCNWFEESSDGRSIFKIKLIISKLKSCREEIENYFN